MMAFEHIFMSKMSKKKPALRLAEGILYAFIRGCENEVMRTEQSSAGRVLKGEVNLSVRVDYLLNINYLVRCPYPFVC